MRYERRPFYVGADQIIVRVSTHRRWMNWVEASSHNWKWLRYSLGFFIAFLDHDWLPWECWPPK